MSFSTTILQMAILNSASDTEQQPPKLHLISGEMKVRGSQSGAYGWCLNMFHFKLFNIAWVRADEWARALLWNSLTLDHSKPAGFFSIATWNCCRGLKKLDPLLKNRPSTDLLRFFWQVRWRSWTDGKHHHLWLNWYVSIRCWNLVTITDIH